ncbi:1592_t:CDS:1 [Funneliformis geosporum]|uniref:19538_t:CDS:1 n=1 Tax=Funneliformis geosporum TaxID=1117311 RepID=A0A9W4SCI4_9GLOM|nr:1592_t:CDS:1 [Funneliformis geosporum]CAI2163377.1 19538_t:CDS:1 [Funneliformis geosporum]
MYINSLETRYKEHERIPIPLEGESYFYRHQPVKFRVEVEGTPIKQYLETGKIFLTDKRLMFISQLSTSIDDNFETFHVMLEDVNSSIISSPRIFKRNTFTVRITLRNGVVFIMSLGYQRKDLEAKKVFQDYYGMLLVRRGRYSVM